MDRDLEIKIEEVRFKLLVAEARFRVEVLKYQIEVECLLQQARVWAATHGGDVYALAKLEREAGE